MESRKLPTFYCPFPSAVHPRADEARLVALSWIRRFRLAEKEVAWHRLDGTRSEFLAARCYPDVTFEQLVLVTEWIIWFFQFDDQFDEGSLGHQPEQVSQVFHGLLDLLFSGGPPGPVAPPEHPEDALATALCDLWQRTCALSSSAWQARFIRDMENYFSAYCQEVENRARGIIPDVESYNRIRRHSGALYSLLYLREAFSGDTLPATVINSAPFQTFWHCTINAISWQNDIVSLAKERARGEVNNLVIVLRHQRQCTWQEAIDMVNEMCTAQIELFLDAERQFFANRSYPASVLATARYCVDGMRDWIRGNLDWSVIALRYNVVEETAPDQTVSYLEPLLSASSVSGELPG